MTKQEKIEATQNDLNDHLADGPIDVFAPEFHGGGLLSRHRTISGASRAIVEYHSDSDCTCGGAVARAARA